MLPTEHVTSRSNKTTNGWSDHIQKLAQLEYLTLCEDIFLVLQQNFKILITYTNSTFIVLFQLQLSFFML